MRPSPWPAPSLQSDEDPEVQDLAQLSQDAYHRKCEIINTYFELFSCLAIFCIAIDFTYYLSFRNINP